MSVRASTRSGTPFSIAGASWLVSHSLPESLRSDCDLSQRSIIVLASSGGTRMRCDSSSGLLAELPEAAYVSAAGQRIGSLAKDIHRKQRTAGGSQHHAGLRLHLR
jgi:hypothetical protein